MSSLSLPFLPPSLPPSLSPSLSPFLPPSSLPPLFLFYQSLSLSACIVNHFFYLFLSSSRQHLESHMYLLIDSLESLQQETYKMLGYERNYTKQQQLKQQFLLKRVSIYCTEKYFKISNFKNDSQSILAFKKI